MISQYFKKNENLYRGV